MADINFGTGPDTGDTLPQALIKLEARIAVLEAANSTVAPAISNTTSDSTLTGSQVSGFIAAAQPVADQLTALGA